MKKIYFDNNATTALDPVVIKALQEALTSVPLNPSSTHFFGQEAKKIIVRCRDTIAQFFKVKPQELIFTSCGTESLNFLIQGFYAISSKGDIISSDVEHPAVKISLESLSKKGAHITYLPAGLWGSIQPFQIERALTPQTRLIVLTAVNSITGVKTDLEAIADIAQRYQIPFVVDGVQLLGKEMFKIPPGISAMAFSGHKIHGPTGIGAAFLRSQYSLPPLILGGNQEYGKRAGTPNFHGIIGLTKAIELLSDQLPHSTTFMQKLRDCLTEGLMHKLGNVVVHGLGPRICNTVHIGFPGVDGETLLLQLDMAGIAASHGSACSSGGLEPSPILMNMGIPFSLAKSSLRFSFSRMNTIEEVHFAVQQIVDRINEQKKGLFNSFLR